MASQWDSSPDVTRDPARVSGAWTIRDSAGHATRIRVEDILANDDPALSLRAAATAIVADIYPEGLSVDRVERVLRLARQGDAAAHSAG